MLGGASSFADLIKVGEWAATVEVELYQSEEQNVVICRHWDQAGKSHWTARGKKSGLREVEGGGQVEDPGGQPLLVPATGRSVRLLKTSQQGAAGQHSGCCWGCGLEGEV